MQGMEMRAFLVFILGCSASGCAEDDVDAFSEPQHLGTVLLHRDMEESAREEDAIFRAAVTGSIEDPEHLYVSVSVEVISPPIFSLFGWLSVPTSTLVGGSYRNYARYLDDSTSLRFDLDASGLEITGEGEHLSLMASGTTPDRESMLRVTAVGPNQARATCYCFVGSVMGSVHCTDAQNATFCDGPTGARVRLAEAGIVLPGVNQ